MPTLFTSNGVPLAATIHRQADPSTRQPTVLVSGSWLTVKEQMADRYAAALVARGFTAITFDFAGWGQSGGDLRAAELPARKIADIRAAAEWAASLSFVDGALGYLGVCATAQYALAAIAQGAPIGAFASVAGWFHDTTSVAPFYGGEEGVAARLARGEEATRRYLATGEVTTVPAYGAGDDNAAMSLEMDYYANPERGAVAQWPNRMAELSWEPWLTFDGLAAARRATAPALFVHSDDCVFPDNVKRLETTLGGPVTLAWGKGAQTDFYDLPEQVDFALEHATAHFREHLR